MYLVHANRAEIYLQMMRHSWFTLTSLACLSDAVLIHPPSVDPDLVSPLAEVSLDWDLKRPQETATARSASPGFPYHDHRDFYNASFEQHYCLKESDFASLPIAGDYSRFINMYDKLSAGGTVRILVLGGSMTAGVRCAQFVKDGQKVTGKSCAWPARFHASLASRFPTATVEMLNIAQGGTTTSVILAGIGMVLRGMQDEGSMPDAVIIDTLVNDASEAKRWDDAGNTSFSTDQIISLSYESLIRSLHELVPNAAVLSFMSGCPNCASKRDSQLSVATFYDLPRLDYSDFRSKHQNMTDLWKMFDSDVNHPSWETHQMIADVVANVLGRAWASGRRPSVPEKPFSKQTLAKQEDVAMFQPCLNVLSGYSARQAFDGTGAQPKITNGWRLFEDRPGKPGWIADSKSATINFHVRFGIRPRLAVVYLRSYEGMGNARLKIGNSGSVLDGLWSSDFKLNVSQSYVSWYNAGARGEKWGQPGFNVPSGAELDLEVTALGGKFKILQVMSC